MKNILKILCLIGLSINGIQAQVVPSPAPSQSKAIVLKGGTVHTGEGQVLENALVAFDQGKITYVGAESNADVDLSTYESVDVNGQHIYPGLILLGSNQGLEEIGAVRATQDQSETGVFNPNVRAIVAYNTDSHLIPVLRSNGILLTQIIPGGGVVSGMSSVVQNDAWNWEDAAYATDEGIIMSWPTKSFGPRWWRGETNRRPNPNYKSTVEFIESALADGLAYSKLASPDKVNLKLEAMRGLYDGSKRFYLRANNAESIIQGIDMTLKYGVKKVVLVGGRDAYYVKDYLKANNIPVVLPQTHRLPSLEDDDVDMPFRMPGMLQKEGILVSMYYGGADQARNIPFMAGTAAIYDMSKEEALKMITLNAAKILGIEDRAGSLVKGKDALIVVSKGDLLDMRSSQVTLAYIQGRKINLDNKHKQLYQRFKSKYTND
ncbi:MAG: amidohydrolase family protein [Bacteroidota bacterium]